MNLLLKIFFKKFLHILNFSCTWHKEASYSRWNNCAYMVNLFVVSLDITVMINI